MLDVIRSRTQGKVAKIIMTLVTVPFVLFGIDTYLNDAGSSVPVAKVNGDKVSIQEYTVALENVRNRLQSSGQKIDAAMLDSPELKSSVLEGLITKRLISDEISHANFKISDEQLSQYVIGMPQFQKEGKFSQEMYDNFLASNHLSPSKFEAGVRNDLTVQQVRDGLQSLVFIPKTNVDKVLNLSNQQREVTVAEIKAKDFLPQVQISPEKIKAYYELHKDKFIAPEKVKIQFALLSAASLIGTVNVDDSEVKTYYDANVTKFQGDEKRHAAHILIGFGANPTPEDKQKAKAKAEQILSDIKKNPERFAELAVKNSQDTGSAVKGGDLPPFGRGEMTKPFEAAAFSMKPNQISELVESEYGYHIIKLIDISGNNTSFDSVKSQIKADLLFQKAQAKYAELADGFGTMAYEQSGSLDPVAKQYHIQLQTSDWMSREDGVKFFKNDRLMSLVFSNDVLKDKHNTEAVEVSPNNLVSARVIDYQPSKPRSFDEVKAGIETVLKSEEATKLAKSKGEAALASLKLGTDVAGLDWIPIVSVDRKNAQGLSDEVMKQVFKISASKMPGYAGFVEPNKGFQLIKLVGTKVASLADENAKKEAEQAIDSAINNEYLGAYAKSLKAKSKVVVNYKLLESNTQNQ